LTVCPMYLGEVNQSATLFFFFFQVFKLCTQSANKASIFLNNSSSSHRSRNTFQTMQFRLVAPRIGIE
jgi:hypothetical protein